MLVGTGEFFEAEDNVLQGFDVRDLVQRRDVQLDLPAATSTVFASSRLVTASNRAMPRAADSSICRTLR